MQLVKKKEINGFTIEILRDEYRGLLIGQVLETSIEEEAKTEKRLLEKIGKAMETLEDTKVEGFRVLIWKTKDTYIGCSPEMPGCITEGETREEVKETIKALIFDALLQMAKDGRFRSPNRDKAVTISRRSTTKTTNNR